MGAGEISSCQQANLSPGATLDFEVGGYLLFAAMDRNLFQSLEFRDLPIKGKCHALCYGGIAPPVRLKC